MTPEEQEKEKSAYDYKVWVPRRSKQKETYGGMLDNTVAGGIASGEDPFESLIREADEEASLPSDFVREKAETVGTVTYAYVREERAGGESGVVQPECQYLWDLELPRDIVPLPKDGEVEEFYAWTVEETQRALERGEFKPNCAVVTVNFFLRRGVIKEGSEGFEETRRRVHRGLEFPGPHGENKI